MDLRHIEEVASSHPLLRGLLRDLPSALLFVSSFGSYTIQVNDELTF
jgi:hypothetical protein